MSTTYNDEKKWNQEVPVPGIKGLARAPNDDAQQREPC